VPSGDGVKIIYFNPDKNIEIRYDVRITILGLKTLIRANMLI
jgi:hypothetical protein